MTFDKLVSAVKAGRDEQVIAVAHATDSSLFHAAKAAMDKQFASFVFVGPVKEMEKLKQEADFTPEQSAKITLVDAENDLESAKLAVQLVKSNEANVLMKGMLSTTALLKAVVNKEAGLRTGKILSHIAGFALPQREQLLFITDAAMNIAPDLQDKVQIIQNAVAAVAKIGIDDPKVAVVGAVETVNPTMQATLDASALTLMNRRGQIVNCVVEGPLSLDIAVSEEAAAQKGVYSEVAGRADIIAVPTIEAGNLLYKSLTCFAGATVGGIIAGAAAPIILTSRADSVESKLFSMAMAVSASPPME
nr:bifunctional enoyl-CoA hydratase/phosphate acetyltransferase [Evansella caseinilytica]